MTKNQFLAIGGFFLKIQNFFLTKSSLIRPLNTVGVVSMIVFDFCILSPGPTHGRNTKNSFMAKHLSFDSYLDLETKRCRCQQRRFQSGSTESGSRVSSCIPFIPLFLYKRFFTGIPLPDSRYSGTKGSLTGIPLRKKRMKYWYATNNNLESVVYTRYPVKKLNTPLETLPVPDASFQSL